MRRSTAIGVTALGVLSCAHRLPQAPVKSGLCAEPGSKVSFPDAARLRIVVAGWDEAVAVSASAPATAAGMDVRPASCSFADHQQAARAAEMSGADVVVWRRLPGIAGARGFKKNPIQRVDILDLRRSWGVPDESGRVPYPRELSATLRRPGPAADVVKIDLPTLNAGSLGRLLDFVIGWQLLHRRQPAEATPFFERAVAGAALAPNDDTIATLLMMIGRAHLAAPDGQTRDGVAFSAELLARLADSGSMVEGVLLNNIGLALRAAGKSNEALAFFWRARNLHEKAVGADHPVLAWDSENAGFAMLESGNWAPASGAFGRALDIDEKAFGPYHPNVGVDQTNLHLALETMVTQQYPPPIKKDRPQPRTGLPPPPPARPGPRAESGEVRCTMMDCTSEVRIHLRRGSSGSTPAMAVELTADGQRFTCPSPQPSASCQPSGTTEIDELTDCAPERMYQNNDGVWTCVPLGRFEQVIRLPGAPKTIDMTLLRDGRQMGKQALHPHYKDPYINGPGCPAACRHADETWDVTGIVR